ncbi:flagellar hook protein FlgE [Terriglobus saanensis]|uniref:Flagellar hook protein FlgE n=1 Tax=Terriglobus saanensis (strain ATCC BAA-1853 / DSM 23119 / SP1PR4) TaxID=401053 RepID=E8V4Z7_TERSS|nr:flagellar hook protein FlgE [Terriglobus saanensis]ADV82625.1 flagellar hook-basal body protein [Terriglobus saanensis SP1PR4]
MPSFSIALSGLKADSVALDTIGNNLANMNSVAYKKQNVNFSDLFYQTIGVSGANTPQQVGLGTQVSDISTDYTQGGFNPGGSSTQMAINGDGFFVVSNGGVQELTRNGDFQLDSSGNLITSDGQSVMGYAATGGVVNGNTALSALNIPTGQTQAATATTAITMTAVLNSGAAVGTSFSTSTPAFDSLGQSHSVTTTFTKTGDNTWDYSVTLPSGDAGAATGNTGTLTFDSNGALISPTTNISNISFTGMKDQASDMNLQWPLYNSTGGGLITQTAVTASSANFAANGSPSGKYQSFSVDSTGTITAQFSNGNTEVLGQVALATVSNEQGLTRMGNDLYVASRASGSPNVGVAGVGGRGDIEGNALELSNVDISTEFANLIVAQRAFEANSKTVTTFDTVTQDTIAMIR